MLHIFFLVFQRDNSLLSLLVFSAHFCFASKLFFFLIENTENTQKKTARTIPSDILALLSFFHSHSHFFILLPQAPTLFFFPLFLFVSHWLSGLAHLLWVGGTYPLLIGDSLADQVLCGLCGGLGTRDGHLPVPSSGDELAFLGDLDPGAG